MIFLLTLGELLQSMSVERGHRWVHKLIHTSEKVEFTTKEFGTR